MTEIRRTDAAARRLALVVLALGAIAGLLLIVGIESYASPLRDWLFAEPRETARRVTVLVFGIAAILSMPLLAFAGWLWVLGSKVLHAREFPPPGTRVIRDTPVVHGQAAALRGRGIRLLAICLVAVSAALWWLLWRVAEVMLAE
jgi:hypothetical protein